MSLKNIKWSKWLHSISAIAAFTGIVFLGFAWLAQDTGSFLGMAQDHLYKDAVTVLLISIAFGIGTLIHQHDERM